MKNYIILSIIFIYNISFGQVQLGTNINGVGPDDMFGESISMSQDGTIIAIGAQFNDNLNGINSGQVRVFRLVNGNTWAQIGNEINGEGTNHRFGVCVSLSSNGQVLAVGSHLAEGYGKVKVFSNINDNWVQLGDDLNGTVNGENFGQFLSISADGTKLAVGSPGFNGNGNYSGAARVFGYNLNSWTQLGTTILGDFPFDYAGCGVSISGDGMSLAVGARMNDTNGTDSGLTKVYSYNSGNWELKGSPIYGESAGDLSGVGVSLSFDGNTLAIGASANDGFGIDSGHVRIFKFDSGIWLQLGENIEGYENSNFGYNLSLSADATKLIVGAYNSDFSSGFAKIYYFDSVDWQQLGSNILAELQYDNCGFDVSISPDGSKVAVGSRFNDNIGGVNAGCVRVFDISNLLNTDSSIFENYILFPNPIQTKLNFIKTQSNSLEILNVKLYSQIGQLLSSNLQFPIDFEGMEKGVYFIAIQLITGVEFHKVIVD